MEIENWWVAERHLLMGENFNSMKILMRDMSKRVVRGWLFLPSLLTSP